MAKGDSSDQILNTPSDQLQVPPEVANAPVDGVLPEEPPEDVKVTKADYRVKSTIGVAPGGKAHRMVDTGEVLGYDEFGEDDAERKTVIERLLGLDAIEPAKDK